ncbi:MAG: DNA (cytosine-5-)-methyltransferase, partial [Synergistaceae bacterium]|nr:DNA (cytosine-5-)-methyltransferase [Synergistaceae bacterium]
VLNHTTFKLSDLDMEMIRSVPPGGNWKNIPSKTVEKSKRLKRITETGGRTTLYGRIDYDKPSYTITTYFNRPGNGTYVHPVHDRVLSVREAARFQCFTDDYYFYGNKTQLLKQVGNAVPTIFAYQIAKNIIDKTDCKKSIHLFCGAGGMTAGFKAAGVKTVTCNDFEESACITLKINNPEIDVLFGDITEKFTKDYLVEKALIKGVDIICGGPPCQGFSMAGLRLTDDPRNQLFRDFIDIVTAVNPKIIVFENVQGLLSFQGGKVHRAILDLFSEVGYNTEARTLMTNDYGVPQKRKRVIIICTRNDLNLKPTDLFPLPLTSEPINQITARETIGDLENVECGNSACYLQTTETDIVKLFKGKIDYATYLSRSRCTKKFYLKKEKGARFLESDQLSLFSNSNNGS